MLYFAYGSNLDKDQMAVRCTSARYIANACLKEYRLDFTRFSKTRGCAVADVVEEDGSEDLLARRLAFNKAIYFLYSI